MRNNIALKLLLLLQTLIVLAYTLVVINVSGLNLFKEFFSDIMNQGWSGQFNLDFSSYLILSGLWIMWRNKFAYKSIFAGIAAMILGIVFFAPYLLYLITKEKGDLCKVLTGRNE